MKLLSSQKNLINTSSMYKQFIIFFTLSTLLFGYVKIEIDSVSTYVPDSENLTLDTSSGDNEYNYFRRSPRLEFGFLKVKDFFEPTSIGIIFTTNLQQVSVLADRLFLTPAIFAGVQAIFNASAATLDDPTSADVVAYDFSLSPYIAENTYNVLSVTRSATIKVSSPSRLLLGLDETLLVKASVKIDANTAYLLFATYGAESASEADIFFQSFSSSTQVSGGDSDGDNLTDFDETFITRTDPQKADSNDDGINDYDDRLLRISNNLFTRVNDTASSYGLLTESEVIDLRPSSTLISVDGDNAVLSLGIEESSNLTDWVDTGETVDANLSAPQGTRFYRFKMTD